MTQNYCYSAPGSIMLMGEHAVLRNKLALVAAVNKRMKVTLTPHTENEIHIYSQLGEYHTFLEHVVDSRVFRFIIAIIQHYKNQLPSGFSLTIEADFSSTVGLGSSSAVVVATIACFEAWLGEKKDPLDLFFKARSLIQAVQGCGSGADVAASVFGGIIAYRLHPFLLEKSLNLINIALIYTGYKTPTPEVIKIVNQIVDNHQKKYAILFEQMNQASEAAWKAIQEKNMRHLGRIMQSQQAAQENLGVVDDKTKQLLAYLNQDTLVLGSKISGSGLGDCVVALISSPWSWDKQEFTRLDVALSSEGVHNECT